MNKIPIEKIKEKRLELQQIYFRISKSIPFDFLERTDFNNYGNQMIKSMVLDLNTYVMGIEGKRIQVYKKWPANWKQAVKERFLPKWLIKKYPVIYDEIDIDELQYKSVCPHLNISNQNDHLEYFINEELK